jgi:hypothetical protein
MVTLSGGAIIQICEIDNELFKVFDAVVFFNREVVQERGLDFGLNHP